MAVEAGYMRFEPVCGGITVADVFIDCEWIHPENVTILGAYSPGQERFQLYGSRLSRNRFSRFLNFCCDRNDSDWTLLFCHGPDIGRIMSEFNLKLKETYYCINTLKALRHFTRFSDASLGHFEEYFGLPRTYELSHSQIESYWSSTDKQKQELVLEYNWEDCKNLWRLVNTLKNRYNVTRSMLKEIAMC